MIFSKINFSLLVLTVSIGSVSLGANPEQSNSSVEGANFTKLKLALKNERTINNLSSAHIKQLHLEQQKIFNTLTKEKITKEQRAQFKQAQNDIAMRLFHAITTRQSTKKLLAKIASLPLEQREIASQDQLELLQTQKAIREDMHKSLQAIKQKWHESDITPAEAAELEKQLNNQNPNLNEILNQPKTQAQIVHRMGLISQLEERYFNNSLKMLVMQKKAENKEIQKVHFTNPKMLLSLLNLQVEPEEIMYFMHHKEVEKNPINGILLQSILPKQ